MRIIAGPCQHENILESFEIASHCRRVCEELGFEYFLRQVLTKLIEVVKMASVALALKKRCMILDSLKKSTAII